MGDIKTYTFTPTGDVTLTASFVSEIQQHTVKIQVYSGDDSYSSATYQYRVGSGSWTSVTTRLSEFTVNHGSEVYVRATNVSSGKKVIWTVSGVEYDTSTNQTINEDVTFYAQAKEETQMVNVKIGIRDDENYSTTVAGATYQYKIGTGNWSSFPTGKGQYTELNVDSGTTISVRATNVGTNVQEFWYINNVSNTPIDHVITRNVTQDTTFYVSAVEYTPETRNVTFTFQDTESANAASYYYKIGSSGASPITIPKTGTTFTVPNGSTLYFGMTNGNMDIGYFYTYTDEFGGESTDTLAEGDVTSAEASLSVDWDQEIILYVSNYLCMFEIKPASASEGAAEVRWKMTGESSSDSKPWTTPVSLTTSVTDTFRRDKIKSIELEVTSVMDEANKHYRFKQISVSIKGKAPTTYESQSISITNLYDPVVATVECTKYYAVNVVQASDGSISPAGTVLVEAGQAKTFTFTPTTNYKVDKILLDGQEVQPDQ